MFELDPAFAATSVPLASLRLCEARLQLDARFAWIVLIPHVEGATELEDLSVGQQQLLSAEIVRAGRAVRATGAALWRPVEKLNVGQLGNVTRQLHVHVVGRRADDACWPGPVWGQGAPVALEPAGLARATAAARAALGSPTGVPNAECATERLSLRRPSASDLEAIWGVHSDPETNRFNPAGPMIARDAAREMLDAWDAHWDRYGFGYWAVCEREQTGSALGFGGVMRKPVGGAEAFNLYFRFRPAAWGKGFATELGGAALALAFDGVGATEVVGLVRPANQPSIRALGRLGMTLTGRLGDVPQGPPSLIYTIGAAAYRARNP